MQRIWLLGIATGPNWFCRSVVSLESFSFVEACGCRRLCLDLDGSRVVRTSDCTLVTISKMLDQQWTNISHIFHTIFWALMISIRPFVDNVELSSPEALGFGDSGVEVFLAPVRTAELSVASEMGTTLALPSPRGVGVFGSLSVALFSFVCFHVQNLIWIWKIWNEVLPTGCFGRLSEAKRDSSVFNETRCHN